MRREEYIEISKEQYDDMYAFYQKLGFTEKQCKKLCSSCFGAEIRVKHSAAYREDWTFWRQEVRPPVPEGFFGKLKGKPFMGGMASVSCAELATMLIKALPNGTFIGERTYGAIGGLYSGGSTNIYHDLFYSGCFGDYEYFENGPDPYRDNFSYYVYTSTFHMVDNTYGDVEGVGVQPDIEIRFNLNRLDDGTDNQLDRAIRFIRVGH